MNFQDKVRELAVRSRHASEHALTEEATKTSVVMPLIQALGFDVFSLNEVIPEFVADVGTKRGEKVDYALRINGEISILIEVKPISASLGSAQYTQLYRYFSVTNARLAILTNGREIWFFPTLMTRTEWIRSHSLFLIFSRLIRNKLNIFRGSKKRALTLNGCWKQLLA